LSCTCFPSIHVYGGMSPWMTYCRITLDTDFYPQILIPNLQLISTFLRLRNCRQKCRDLKSNNFLGPLDWGKALESIVVLTISCIAEFANRRSEQLLPSHEMAVESARIFDMDCYYQTLIFARRISGMGGTHMLKKINLTDPNQSEDIKLPSNTKAVKDLHVSPCGRLVLLASMGKKLSIISMGCNKVVISYSLPGPAWSCSWDPNSSHYMYAGLQNGMLLVFDMRQTVHPVQSINGLSSRPIHTIHSFEHKPTLCHGASLLTASAIGPCVPFLLPELDYQGMCTSLAYSPSSDDIVATYCPKIQMSKETGSSQPHLPAVLGQEALSSQIHVKRVAGSFYQKLESASTHVGNFFLAKSAIINVENCLPMFAYGDDVTCGLTLRDLPSLIVSHILKPHQHPIRDVKYTHSKGSSLPGCISDDKLQLFSAKFL
ncbi:E3 ubiquitin-protein ligase RFWD3, partial [Camellia lanceoleosa]